jgi:hypothetical protein
MWFETLLKYRIKERGLPRYTPKSDLPRATKELKEKNLRELFARQTDKELEKELNKPKSWIEKDDKIVRDMERAGARKNKRELEGWLKSFAREDAREMKRFEREMSRE